MSPPISIERMVEAKKDKLNVKGLSQITKANMRRIRRQQEKPVENSKRKFQRERFRLQMTVTDKPYLEDNLNQDQVDLIQE